MPYKDPKQQKAWQHARYLRLRKEKRAVVDEHFSSHHCVDCGESDRIVLEFDHVRGTKYKDVSQMLIHNYSIEDVRKEIAKCEVRCANCH